MKASVLLLTFNEEANLPRCLEALRWCDDVVVVDSGSSDKTVEIAKRAGARVLQNAFINFAEQRNFGLDNGDFAHEWILHLDADEVVPAEFAGALNHLEPPSTIHAYRVPSKLILFGKWIKYAGMYPTYQVRLGRRDKLRFVQVGHGQREQLQPEQIATFDTPYLHYSFSAGMQSWLRKHVRYAYDEAHFIIEQRSGPKALRFNEFRRTDLRRRAKEIAAFLPLCLRPVTRFFYVYMLKMGFLDGRAGLAYAVMLAVYEGMMAVCYYEISAASKD